MIELTKAIQLVGKPVNIKTSDATMARFEPAIVKIVSVEAIKFDAEYKSECYIYFTNLEGDQKKENLNYVTIQE